MNDSVLFPGPFENSERPCRHSEPYYSYYNCAAGEVYDRIRAVVESWSRNYPAEHYSELRKRFQSRDNRHFHSAFFELFLHETLIRLGYEVTVHPELETTTKHPEFLVENEQEKFILEAIVATNLSKADEARQAQVNNLYDLIDDNLDSPDFFWSIEVLESSTTTLKSRNVLNFLRECMQTVRWEELWESLNQTGFDNLPIWRFETDGWSFEFFPVPKGKARGQEGVRPLSMFPSGPIVTEPRDSIMTAIKRKATRYDKLGMPYIIAVNAFDVFADDIAVQEALFGKEVVVYRTDPQGNLVGQAELQRRPDGRLFYKGPVNKRVSGVLMFNSLVPTSVALVKPCLYHNPWAEHPYDGLLNSLPNTVVVGNRFEMRHGIMPREVLNLPTNWPMGDNEA